MVNRDIEALALQRIAVVLGQQAFIFDDGQVFSHSTPHYVLRRQPFAAARSDTV
jgi:hypothetical protein